MLYYNPDDDYEELTDDELDYLLYEVSTQYKIKNFGGTGLMDILIQMEDAFTKNFESAYYVIDYSNWCIKIYPGYDDFDKCVNFLKDYLYVASYTE